MTAAPGRLCVLVLGAGSNVSQGILKALRAGPLRPRIVAACVDARSAGLWWGDVALLSPPAADAAFVPWLREVCEREGVDAILSGVEPVLEVLAELEDPPAPAVVSSPGVLAVGADKLVTAQWLADQGLPHALSAAADDEPEVDALVAGFGFPVLVKPRRGRSAVGVRVLAGPRELDGVRGDPELVVQRFLPDAASELTAGCFCDRDGAVRGTIVMRRELHAGTTVSARTGAFPEARAVAEEVVAALRPWGPCNVQMRVADGVPIPFELNVRFSGTTPIRAHLGFDEVTLALRHLVGGEAASDLPRVERGAALRYWEEVYVDPDALDAVAAGERMPGAREDATVGGWR